ncbi:XRE family transcriptional regulator [Chryseotalea sanaruensis]|uniref:XRE family transcriptional regulator n=1 Tax=Chryseotalea sanaruensis TaxID=2482724 RepID=A0A401U626_9BACT|nr:helix-turn-helix transcriptional regulator [Chryseotalea sanaruensis]GCC50337.1 XRE family transcriptional regulator [Chryseotalea sanaruensis]
MSRFGEYVRTKRIEKRLLLRQLSASLSVDPAYLSKIERGEKNCNKILVKKIAAALEVNLEELTIIWLIDSLTELERNEPLARKAIMEFIRI